MAKVPDGKKHTPFDKYLNGTFGMFKTSDSYELNYLMTSIKIDNLELLKSASEALNFDKITFEELVQRDIDYERVDRDLVQYYLEKGKDRVIFFPPILVTLFPIDEKGSPIKQFQIVDTDITENEYVKTWDKNKFRLHLPLSSEVTDYQMKHEGKTLSYYNYAATIEYNSKEVILIVLDGQHRYWALKRIVDNKKIELLDGSELPVCVFFSPNALKNGPEELTKNMRELFVRINSTAKQVSGHFIVLLNDRSLSSYCVRGLANYWKELSAEGKPGLHMLEWNQREERAAYRRMKPYSVSTVSIISNALQQYVMSNGKGNQLPDILLKLSEVQKELSECENAIPYDSICDDNFSISQVGIIEKQIRKYMTPSLHILFMYPPPYEAMAKDFSESLTYLDNEIGKHRIGARQYKENVLFQFRQTSVHDQQTVQDFEHEFESRFDIDENNTFFFTNLFQQGLIRAWADTCKILTMQYNISPPQIAESFIKALKLCCFETKKNIFSSLREYNMHTIYSAPAKIKLNETSREQTKNLILSTFINNKVAETFCADYSKHKTKIIVDLKNIAEKAIGNIFGKFYSENRSYINKNWRFMELGDRTHSYLLERENSESEEKQREYEEKIDELTDKKLEKAKKVFCNLTEIKVEDIKFLSEE